MPLLGAHMSISGDPGGSCPKITIAFQIMILGIC